ncbi:Rieske (2Fe-2S) protein [Pseudomonas sp. gcc21]|uniref:Rieske (2Fe-2S) protein n=1 Tax=Pseudomonas sp. gcc21 TaxID=2726989 RepID=UPI001451BBBC|nr:Rieske (2Fe-2S) protein [Pseudomonas sp. gcc21]QJD60285.1 Rieske (2Fe-2S) protein [Pseudomonas sp. gcc21]
MTKHTHHREPRALCRLDELPDPGSKGFANGTTGILVVRQGGEAFVYENRCPHRGIPLEWTPDQFLDSSGRLIQCATHGALFLPESGECIAGPCSGDSLRKLDSYLDDGLVWLGKANPP